ncbi:MAG: PHP domain-containing protein [Deltaproteobacteria bacterium]|nr:PHP domain-containing protein [Deltaproteobacteria bacterium]MBW1994457.1 PHP domain-containing protein [Deltaproteobacteria bacterium]MBW2152038.1 PHP domain-containing protein [Deltaproteobacteria bacterium]
MEYKNLPGIDLHIHSNASDGTLFPWEILARARRLNLKAIAITDHDTVEGCRAAFQREIPSYLKFLTGVEISAAPPFEFSISGSFHILGYGIDLDDPGLNRTLNKLQLARKNRNPKIIGKLRQMGIDISLDELREEFGEKPLGRPHIAQLMVKKNYVTSIDDAFDYYIGKNKPAYVDKFRIVCSEAIDMISEAGGVAVLAHPYLLKMNRGDRLEDLLIHLKSLGLVGLEVYYPDHPPEATDLYIRLAKRHDLLMTGGTDFHGSLNPEIEMGSGNGSFYVPYRLYEELARYLLQADRKCAL